MGETILVTGGTGTLGRLVVPMLREKATGVRVLSRRGGDVNGDLETGAGVAEAVAGVDTVVHLAGSQKGDARKARNLIAAIKACGGTPHVVYISVVGADRIPVVSAADRAMFGYFAEKRAAEVAIEQSGLPFTTLRATQFHELVLKTFSGPVLPVFPGVAFQPVDAAEVAQRLVALTFAEPAGLVPDFGGPRIRPMKELASAYLKATGKWRPRLVMPGVGGAYRAVRDGAVLAPDQAVGRVGWEEFLSRR